MQYEEVRIACVVAARCAATLAASPDQAEALMLDALSTAQRMSRGPPVKVCGSASMCEGAAGKEGAESLGQSDPEKAMIDDSPIPEKAKATREIPSFCELRAFWSGGAGESISYRDFSACEKCGDGENSTSYNESISGSKYSGDGEISSM